MIVTDFEIDRFREGPPLRVLDLGNGLNVALVHSQGGHDLLLNFIPATLYGPDWHSYHSLDTSIAQLTLRTEQGVFTVERDAGLEHAGATIFAPDGSHFSQAFIDDLVDGVSPGNFREVFTFSLDRVGRQDESRILRMARFLRERSPEPVGDVTVSHANLQGPQLALNELAKLIGHEAAKQQTPSGKEGPVKDRAKIERELKKADGLISDGRQKLQHLSREIDETQCALALNRAHARLSQVDREIAEAQPKKAASETPVADGTLDRLNNRISECKTQLKQLAEEKADLLSHANELGNGGRVKKHLPQIEAMLLHEKSMLKEEDALEQLKLSIENLEARLESDRLQESEQLSAGPRTPNSHELARLDSIANRLREVEHQQELAERRLAHAETDQLAHHEIRASDSRPHPSSSQDAVTLHEAEQRLAGLQQQLELDEQMHRLDAERTNIAARIRRLHHGQLMPAGRVAVLGVLFAIGIALVIWGLFMHGGEVHWQKVLLGGAMAIAASLIKLVADRESVYALESERGRLAHVNHQLEALAANHAERGLDTAAVARQIELTENEIDRLRSLFVDEPAIDDATPFASLSLEESRYKLDDLRRRHQELSQDWRDLLMEFNLSPTYTPSQARDALSERAAQSVARVPAHSETESQLRIAQAELDRRREWVKSLAAQARQLVKDLGHTPGDSLIEHFDILRDTVVEHREHEQTRKQLGRSLKRIREKESQIKQTGKRYTEQKKQLGESARLKKEQEHSKRQLASDRLKLLQDQRERLQEDIDEIRTRYGIETQTPLAEFTDSELEQRLENQQQKLGSLRDQMIQQSEKRGHLRAELAMGSPEQHSTEPTSWVAIVDKTKLLAEQLTGAESIEHVASQPSTPYYLHRAAEYLATLSGGQFNRMECPTDDTLILGDEEGRSITLDRVRHEHFPNIYFSLWLARIEVYSDRGVRLPVILDDPLKVTEQRRKKPLAKLLKQFGARGYQAVLVTDEESHADLFSGLEVPVADLSQREIVTVEEPSEVGTSFAEHHAPMIEESAVARR